MTPNQCTALACRMAALVAVGSAIWMGVRHAWILAAALTWGACFLAYVGGRHQEQHLAERARHDRARRAAHADAIVIGRPVPCCSFWKNSDGKVHGPDCPLPPETRHVRDGRPLDEAETAAFNATTASLDLPGPDPRSTA